MFKAGDICEVIQGPFRLASWTDPKLIGKRVTILGLHPDLPSYYIVEEYELSLHRLALRLLPPRDDSRDATTWDKCVWQPREVRV